MSQKFIDRGEKTQKKAPVYDQQKTKRFTRKRSQQSQRSMDSKRSNKTTFQPLSHLNGIGDKQPRNAQINIRRMDFCEHLANQVMIGKQLLPNRQYLRRPRTDRYHHQDTHNGTQPKRQSIDYESQTLTAQLNVRNKQLQLITSQYQLIKYSLQVQQQKRRKIQLERQETISQLTQKSKQLQDIQIQNKKLVRQKECLIQQIQFLQRINYDDKMRSVQSYRQKYLTKQIDELRKQMSMNKSYTQRHLEAEVKRISHEKYSIETLYKALKVEKQTLVKLFQRYRIKDKGSVYHSQQYVKLREKYKLCLHAYKKLKIDNFKLQLQLNRSLSNIPQYLINSNASLSIVLSSSSSQKSSTSLDKQNNKLRTINGGKNFLSVGVSNQKTPIKKSLSPRNRQQKPVRDFKRTSSPNSNQRPCEMHNTSLQPKNPQQSFKSKQRSHEAHNDSLQPKNPQQPFKNNQKTGLFFNQAYRLKIGLGRLPPQNKR